MASAFATVVVRPPSSSDRRRSSQVSFMKGKVSRMSRKRDESESMAHKNGPHRRTMPSSSWLAFVVVAVTFLLVLLLAHPSDCSVTTGGEGSETDTTANAAELTSYEPGIFYQDNRGYLCLDGTCYDGHHQESLIRRQLYKKHSCTDLRDYCRNASDVDCASQPRLHAYCPQTCRVCHNRTITTKLQAEDRDAATATTTAASTTAPPGGNNVTNNPPRPPTGAPSSSPPSIMSSTTTTATKQKTRTKSKYRADIESVIPAIGSDLGVPQIVTDRAMGPQIEQALEDARHYVQYTVHVDDQYWTVRDKCVNRHSLCAQYAVEGKCGMYEDDIAVDSDTSTFMQQQCAPMCQTCEQLHYLARCPIDMNQKNAWYPDDLDAMFERIVNDPIYQQYHNVTVLSRPRPDDDDNRTAVDDKDAPLDGPWLIVLENFTTVEEAQRLIELGGILGYERSEDVGDEDETGEVDSVVSVGRTSTNAWCDVDKCEDDPIVSPLIERMEQLTGIPRVYTEHLQLLRYEVGQFYEEHHDYIEIDRLRYAGVRILTVFLYLNTVEEGGETNFPFLGPSGLSVHPRQGRVVLWPSVLNDDPHLKDGRTNHQAMPVIKGIKYGANAWYHQRHIRAGFDLGC